MTSSESLGSIFNLERRILHGLVLECDVARTRLGEAHGKHLLRPIFRLAEMKNRWGTWCRWKREITISRRLALHHSWFEIRDVLLHEMAHQLSEELLGGERETPHGPRFREACRLLGANPDASGDYQPMEGQDGQKASSLHPNDRILLRVRKLFALAGSENPHEAQTAMEKAQSLMARYNLELIATSPGRSFRSRFLGSPALRHPIERTHLANLLQDFYFVSAVWVPVYVISRGRMGRALEISGTRENLEMAEYVFDFVNRYIDRHWHLYRKAGKREGARKSEFATGVIDGFRTRIEQSAKVQSLAVPRTQNTLLPVKDPLLGHYVADRYPFLRTTGRRIILRNEEARRHGLERGRDLVIHRPIESRGVAGSGGLLPGHS